MTGLFFDFHVSQASTLSGIKSSCLRAAERRRGNDGSGQLRAEQSFCRVGFAHRFRGIYAFMLVGGAHPTKHVPE